MKAAFLTGIRKIELREIPDPQIKKDNEVLLRLGAAGICGSDVQYYLTGKIGSQAVQFPFIAGHECAAVVEEIGRNVTRLKPGDRVVVNPAVSCGECDQCLEGRRHTCRSLLFLGFPGQLNGCLAEFIVMPQTNCYPIKNSTTLSQAVLVEPFSIGLYALEFLSDDKVKSIGILGSGPIGLSVALAAKITGIHSIYMTDKVDSRLETAQKAGASWIGNPDKSDIVSDIQFEEPHLLDAVFECCGDQAALDQAIELLKPGGKLMIIGIPYTDRVSLDVHKIRRKEICIQNVRRQNDCIQKAIDLIENRQVDVDFMATHYFDLEKTQEAFELAASYRDKVIKAIIRFH